MDREANAIDGKNTAEECKINAKECKSTAEESWNARDPWTEQRCGVRVPVSYTHLRAHETGAYL
eukprot:2709543-Pyramimonas_sp.AAC.1